MSRKFEIKNYSGVKLGYPCYLKWHVFEVKTEGFMHFESFRTKREAKEYIKYIENF